MKPVEATRHLAASPSEVFAILSQPEASAKVIPCIRASEVLPGQSSGVGMRFRETRANGKREMTMEFEVMEWEEPSRLRIECDAHGTLWDSTYHVSPDGDGTKLSISMDARAQKMLPRILNPLMKPLFRKGIAQHLDALEAHFGS